ncbi:MAG TPA: ABC transporter permease [Candidatus Acidoferrum sp.]|nr:ABC transporter permease [Candidatus Acidoferrum sp.]
MMRSMYAVYRKEIGHYFVSPVAYVVVSLFLLLSAFFFNLYLRDIVEQSFGMPPEFDAPSQMFRAFLGLLALLILFFMPMVTMGLFAEERKRGTMELLMTSPIREVDIVIGKFLASLTLFAAMLLPTGLYVVYVWLHTDPSAPLRMVFAGYLGVILFGGCLLALGSFISSLTENQIIAAALTFGAFLFLWAIDFGSRNAESALGQTVQYLSVINHFEDFTRGIIDTSGVVYYLSFIAFFVFLTVRSIDSLRWRRA